MAKDVTYTSYTSLITQTTIEHLGAEFEYGNTYFLHIYQFFKFKSSQVTMKYFFSFPWQLKHCSKDFSENANSIKIETLKTSNITGNFTNFIRFLLSERKQV